MPRNSKKKQDESGKEKAKWAGFVNVYLAPQEKEQIKRNLLTPEQCLSFLLDMGQAGYKVSWSWSDEGGFWSVSLTGQYAGLPNAGLTMTQRHSDAVVAITALQWCATEDGLNADWTERWTVAGENDW